MISFERLVNAGEYLGFCDQKGYVYSIFHGYNKFGKPEYGIYSVLNGVVTHLITYPILKEDKVDDGDRIIY